MLHTCPHPQEPTQAELDPAMQALLVSQETLQGGRAINAGRVSRGFPPLVLLTVGLVGRGDGAAGKLSSSALRAEDAHNSAGSTGTGRSSSSSRAAPAE